MVTSKKEQNIKKLENCQISQIHKVLRNQKTIEPTGSKKGKGAVVYLQTIEHIYAGGGGGARGASTHQTHEMTVPNEIIGCVIGKGGSKIAEIR